MLATNILDIWLAVQIEHSKEPLITVWSDQWPGPYKLIVQQWSNNWSWKFPACDVTYMIQKITIQPASMASLEFDDAFLSMILRYWSSPLIHVCVPFFQSELMFESFVKFISKLYYRFEWRFNGRNSIYFWHLITSRRIFWPCYINMGTGRCSPISQVYSIGKVDRLKCCYVSHVFEWNLVKLT